MRAIESELPALYLPEEISVGTVFPLPEEETRHVRALRLRQGEPVLLLDGRGGRWKGEIAEIDKRSAHVRATESELARVETGPYIALGLGLVSDKARFEWCIEKSVELGVREIIPIATERSQGRFHRDRAERIAVSALKQSQRPFLPLLRDVTPLSTLLAGLAGYDLACICHEQVPAEQSLPRVLLQRQPERLILLIGPEGGFTEAEVASAEGARAVAVSISDARLRSETAALAAAAVAKSLLVVAK